MRIKKGDRITLSDFGGIRIPRRSISSVVKEAIEQGTELLVHSSRNGVTTVVKPGTDSHMNLHTVLVDTLNGEKIPNPKVGKEYYFSTNGEDTAHPWDVYMRRRIPLVKHKIHSVSVGDKGTIDIENVTNGNRYTVSIDTILPPSQVVTFQRGDKVRIINHKYGYDVSAFAKITDEECTVVEIDSTGDIHVRRPSGNNNYVYFLNLEKVKKDHYVPIELVKELNITIRDDNATFMGGRLFSARELDKYLFETKISEWKGLKIVSNMTKKLVVTHSFNYIGAEVIKDAFQNESRLAGYTVSGSSQDFLSMLGLPYRYHDSRSFTLDRKRKELYLYDGITEQDLPLILSTLDLIFKDQYVAPKMSEVLSAIHETFSVKRKKEAKEKHGYIEDEISSLYKSLLSKRRLQKEHELILNSDPANKKFQNIKKVTTISYARNTIMFWTKPLSVTVNEHTIVLGEFKCSINLKDNVVKIYNITRTNSKSFWEGESHAPHVDQKGNPCLGGFNDVLIKLIMAEEYDAAISTVIGFIESVNLDDSAGKMWYTWEPDKTKHANLKNKVGKDSASFICAGCNSEYTMIEFNRHDEGPLCNTCHDDNYFYCESCDEDIKKDESGETYVENSNHVVCNSCYDEYISTCDGCNTGFYTNNMTYTSDDLCYCENCLSEKTSNCKRCNELFSNSALTGDTICETCAKELQKETGDTDET